MEHFWSPFFIFLAAFVTAVVVPIVVWKLAQIKSRQERESTDEAEERDFQLECYLWKAWHTSTNNTWRATFQAWLEGEDLATLNALMVALDLAFRNHPSPPDKH